MTHSCPLCHREITAPVGVLFNWESGLLTSGQFSAKLTHQEADIFAVLWAKLGTFLRYDAIAIAVWGSFGEAEAEYSMMKVQVCRIRKKISKMPIRIETRNSVGYRLTSIKGTN